MAFRSPSARRAPWPLVLLLTACLPLGPDDASKNDFVVGSPYLAAILKPPAGWDTTRTYPLVVALHGNGGTAGGFAPLMAPFAAASYYVAVPEAPYARSDGGYSWFYLIGDRTLWESYDTLSVRAVVALVATLRERYHIGEVYLLGFSQGVSLAYMTAFRNPALVRGVAAISGFLPEIDTVGAIVRGADVDSAQGVRVFVARGTGDDVISRREYLRQVDLLTSHAYAITTFEFDGGHELTNRVVGRALEWLRAEGRR